ncbi:hypothetical protein OsJ_34391 [Oryza sativa Japonica Group]|nr:hypothetical protein OsJ_34391 [Oryza sativa Japonica Group]
MPSKDEMDQIIKQMPSDRALGPDGFNGMFLKKCWHIISEDFYAMADQFFSGGISIQNLNNSFITLVPKKPNPESPNDYRPIALQNSVLKFVSKIMANRLQSVILDIIHENQYVFIKDIPLTLIWKSKGTMKIKVFLWLLLMDILNTKDLLQRKHFNTQGGVTCNICNLTTTEDYIHLFFSCPFAQQCWNCIGINWDLTLEFMNMIMTARRLFPQPFFMEVLGIGCWNIWNRRNDHIFNNVPINFSKWKLDFKEDFTRHMHRVKASDKPSWQSWINIIS